MTNPNENSMQRRRFLKLVSTSAVLAPLASLTACSGGEEAPQSAPADAASARPAPTPAATPEPRTPATTPGTEPTGDMPRLEESDPQARSLSYVHDASSVDASKFPRYEEGQICANCALYLDQNGAEWGGCSIFPGKLVNANGWCSVWAPQA